MGSVLDLEDPLVEEITAHSSILAGVIPWTEEALVGYKSWVTRL